MLDPFLFLELSESSFILLPFFALLLVAFLMIPATIASPGNPVHAAKAILCYLMQATGLVMIAITTLYVFPFLIAGQMLPVRVFAAPLLVFVAGIWLVIHFAKEAHMLDKKAAAVPRAIFYVSFEGTGIVLILIALLHLGAAFLSGPLLNEHGLIAIHWELPVTLLLLGVLLTISCARALLPTKAPAKKGKLPAKLSTLRRKKA